MKAVYFLSALLALTVTSFASDYAWQSLLEASALRTANDTSTTWSAGTCDQFTLKFSCTLADLVVSTGFIPVIQSRLWGGTWTTVATVDTINAIGTTYYTVNKDDLSGAATFWGDQFRLLYVEEGTADSNTASITLYRFCDTPSGKQ